MGAVGFGKVLGVTGAIAFKFSVANECVACFDRKFWLISTVRQSRSRDDCWNGCSDGDSDSDEISSCAIQNNGAAPRRESKSAGDPRPDRREEQPSKS